MYTTSYTPRMVLDRIPMNREILVSRINAHEPNTLPKTRSESAVMVFVVYDHNDRLSVVLTKRSKKIEYAGDYCFPGGKKERGDRNFETTVMREISEELNLGEAQYQIIGQLNDFQDRNGHRVRPFVAILSKEEFVAHVRVSPNEIVDIHFFPMSEFGYIVDSKAVEQFTRRSPSYLYLRHEVKVWGLTAGIMTHFANIVFNQDKPVGYEVKK